MTYEPHPASLLLPQMGDEEFAALCDDIRDRGLLEPIDRIGQLILDGNNRYRACREVGITPRFVDWDGADPIAYVLSKNVHRRHLDASQRAMVAADTEDLYAAEAAARKAQAPGLPQGTKSLPPTWEEETEAGEAIEKAAKQVGASRTSAARAKRVKKASPELAAEVRAGRKTVNEAEREVVAAQAAAQAAADYDAAVADFPVLLTWPDGAAKIVEAADNLRRLPADRQTRAIEAAETWPLVAGKEPPPFGLADEMVGDLKALHRFWEKHGPTKFRHSVSLLEPARQERLLKTAEDTLCRLLEYVSEEDR